MTFKSRILVVEADQRNPLYLAPDSSVTLSSLNAPWTMGSLEQQRLPPNELQRIFMPEHLLSIQLTPHSNLNLECRSDGRLRSWDFNIGDVFFAPALLEHDCRWFRDTEVINIALAPNAVREFALESFDHHLLEFLPHQGGVDVQTYHIALALRAEVEANYPGGRLFGEGLIQALTVHLLRRYTVFPLAIADRSGGLSKIALKRVTSYIRDTLQADLSLRALADVVHHSPYHFARQFKIAAGMTPHQYVLRCRLEAAKRLLQMNVLSVESIAHQVGFVDRSHLSRAFRRAYGVTPTQMRGTPKSSADDPQTSDGKQ